MTSKLMTSEKSGAKFLGSCHQIYRLKELD